MRKVKSLVVAAITLSMLMATPAKSSELYNGLSKNMQKNIEGVGEARYAGCIKIGDFVIYCEPK